jgi:hypothetical protein
MGTLIPLTQAPPMLFCYACGHHWYQRAAEPPGKCPNCQSRTWFNPNSPHRHGRHFHASHHPATPTLPGMVEGTTAPTAEETPRLEGARSANPDTSPGGDQ